MVKSNSVWVILGWTLPDLDNFIFRCIALQFFVIIDQDIVWNCILKSLYLLASYNIGEKMWCNLMDKTWYTVSAFTRKDPPEFVDPMTLGRVNPVSQRRLKSWSHGIVDYKSLSAKIMVFDEKPVLLMVDLDQSINAHHIIVMFKLNSLATSAWFGLGNVIKLI